MAVKYVLKVFITGETTSSGKVLKGLNNILEEELKGLYKLEVINVLKHPQLAEEDKILATPTLIKVLPPPIRKIIGELSDKEKVLVGLDLTTKSICE